MLAFIVFYVDIYVWQHCIGQYNQGLLTNPDTERIHVFKPTHPCRYNSMERRELNVLYYLPRCTNMITRLPMRLF
jgi:hypothetical protein